MRSNGAVLVVTTDPLRNPNYGGILQAWALCEALKNLGYEPWIYDKRSTKLWRAWYALVRFGCRFVPHRLTLRWWYCWPENQTILKFARSNLRYSSSSTHTPRTETAASAPFVAYVTGSDQVWRPEIYDAAEKLLGFVDSGFTGPRIAYAASFGKNDLTMFNDQLRAKTKPLAQQLTAVSVREESGIAMAKQLWDVDAQRVTDPVFLLGADEYRERFDIADERDTLVTYILDPNEDAESLVSELLSEEELGIKEVIHLSVHGKNSSKPTVEEWLRAIGSAKYVLTDSFHGTAFSILLNKPFIAFRNQYRGGTRFDSLFAVYQHDPAAGSYAAQLLHPSTAKGERLRIVQTERETGAAYLRAALGWSAPADQRGSNPADTSATAK
jgi:hypothetical protein